jgi:hypothetical protein
MRRVMSRTGLKKKSASAIDRHNKAVNAMDRCCSEIVVLVIVRGRSSRTQRGAAAPTRRSRQVPLELEPSCSSFFPRNFRWDKSEVVGLRTEGDNALTLPPLPHKSTASRRTAHPQSTLNPVTSLPHGRDPTWCATAMWPMRREKITLQHRRPATTTLDPPPHAFHHHPTTPSTPNCGLFAERSTFSGTGL